MYALLALTLAAAPAPTQAELAKYGAELAGDFAAGTDGLATRLDMDALLDRTLAGVPASDKYLEGFRKGAKKGGLPLGQSLLAQLAQGGSFVYRKVVTLDGESAVMLRFLGADGGFNYYQLVVANTPAGLKVVDLHDLVQGEKLSASLRRLALIGLGEAQQGLIDKLQGKEQVFLANLPKIRALTEQLQKGAFEDALATWGTLPKELQDERTFLRHSVTAAAKVNDAVYEKQLSRYLALYPADPASNVMAIDFFFLRKKWQDAGRAVDAVEKAVGADDAWFEMLRANLSEAAGDRPGAKAHLRKAVGREPLLQAYQLMIGFALEEKDWPATAKWLAAMESDAHIPLKDLTTVPEYKDFVASKEGKAFVKRKR